MNLYTYVCVNIHDENEYIQMHIPVSMYVHRCIDTGVYVYICRNVYMYMYV